MSARPVLQKRLPQILPSRLLWNGVKIHVAQAHHGYCSKAPLLELGQGERPSCDVATSNLAPHRIYPSEMRRCYGRSAAMPGWPDCLIAIPPHPRSPVKGVKMRLLPKTQ